MQLNELFPALGPVVAVFDKIGILYYIGGSISSSIHGIPRSTMDIDIIADIKPEHIEALYLALEPDYYIDKDMIREAIKNHSSFNIIHFNSMMKIDIFILKKREFDKEAFRRKKLDAQDIKGDRFEYFISSPEDIILSKLEWFKMGGEVSERQWRDIIGVLKVQGNNLDMEYLEKWIGRLNLTDLWNKLLKEK
ncbi:MAG: hypothetical protein ACM3SY_21715 [Candidatus Omnitrophota bacterium]